MDGATLAGFVATITTIGFGMLKMYSGLVERMGNMELRQKIMCIVVARSNEKDKDLLEALVNGDDEKEILEKLLT